MEGDGWIWFFLMGWPMSAIVLMFAGLCLPVLYYVGLVSFGIWALCLLIALAYASNSPMR